MQRACICSISNQAISKYVYVYGSLPLLVSLAIERRKNALNCNANEIKKNFNENIHSDTMQ